ncbi:MAG: Type 1 glutamine amidotransferase-like domain-containing protein [Clostridia bacterium]|nr:Type 1 glutamine amidotransferase-like domain-containing protein [Clostridia bacterium]
MNGRRIGFFSGFPNRQFTDEIACELKKLLYDRESLVFISAWPDRFKQNDEDSEGMHNMFVAEDMSFERFSVIDERTDGKIAQKEIENASCLFLMGGNATAQMDLIRRKGIFDQIRAFKGVILGVSAGSMNMGNPVVDIYESVVPYEGFGFAGLTVKSHYPITDPHLASATEKVSMEMPVTLMKDESAILITDDGTKLIGEIFVMDRGEVRNFSKADLKMKS